MDLSPEEVRVLGALLEKELATPDYYPLTLNSLRTACNQKSNRDPVCDFSESQTIEAIDGLYRRHMVGHVTGAGSRATKYRHTLSDQLGLDRPRKAVLALLLLRGPQTAGEIRGRSGRLFPFDSIEVVDAVLEDLAARDEPLVVRMERQPGKKEARYAHLLSGMPEPGEEPAAPTDRVGALEVEVAELRSALDSLSEQFETFRASFE